MMKFKLIKSSGVRDTLIDEPRPHEDILDLLFKHKDEIHRYYSDIKGIHYIDHFAIKIFDKSGQFLIFSATPSVEYNLIIQDLWRYDMNFNPHIEPSNKLRVWDSFYCPQHHNELKYFKETKHGFQFSFDIVDQIDRLKIFYSFATRSKAERLENYYDENIESLISVGSYAYQYIKPLYEQYAYGCHQNRQNDKTRTLKLIIGSKMEVI